MDFLLGIFLLVLGISVAFIGVQLFLVMLPIVGFITGFYIGAEMVAAWLGDGFLATVTGWLAGLVIGVLFAAIARYWWYAGVLISAGAVGAILISRIAHAVGADAGITLFLAAIVGAVTFVIVTLMLDLPIYLVIWNTALSGAAIAISGLMLLFNQIEREHLEYGAAVAAINESWFWVLAFAVLAAVGVVRQLTLKEQIRLPDYRWSSAQKGL